MNNDLVIAKEALEKILLQDIVIYDFTDVSPFYDYQIVASASNERQVQASIRFIVEAFPEKAVKVEGKNDARWILFDLGNILIHVMHKETRAFYQIEKLFIERPKLSV